MLSPAQEKYLHAIAADLDMCSQGERGHMVARAASFLNCSRNTVYRRLKMVAGYDPERKPRSDFGKRKTTRELALMVSGIVQAGTRDNKKQTISIKDARRNLEQQGYGVMDEETGEITMPSASALSRAMREEGCHPKQIAAGTTSVRMRSLHPNHVWQIDASVCVLYYLPNDSKKKLRIMDEKKYNEKKPGKLAEIGNFRIIRYVIADHTSHCLYVHYERAKGEDATGIITALINAMAYRGNRDPMHGVPLILYLDKSGGNQSSLVKDFCKALSIQIIYHEAGNAKATGSVEVAQNLVERNFEGWLRFADVPDIATLQALADKWRQHFNAHEKHTRLGLPRSRAWMRITPEQLRVAEREVLQALAMWGAVTRAIKPDFTISVDTRTRFGTMEYDLRQLGYDGLNVGQSVSIALNPFKAPSIVVSALVKGEEKRWEVSPIVKDENGFDVNAPVYGENFKTHADTATDKAVKDIAALGLGASRKEFACKGVESPVDSKPKVEIQPFAHIKEAPETVRRRGHAVSVSAPVVEAMPLSHVQAAKRLRAINPEPWQHDAAACMEVIKALYPVTVPETALDDLVVKLANATPVNVAAFIKPESLIRLEHAALNIGGAS